MPHTMASAPKTSGTSAFKLVQPGSETGVFHILVAGLPFGATWQDLKDFVRPVCEVDHVEVFGSSTSGWVRVLGEDNFRRAFKHLNGGVMGDRALIADGANQSKPQWIREFVDTLQNIDTQAVSRDRSSSELSSPRSATADYSWSSSATFSSTNSVHGYGAYEPSIRQDGADSISDSQQFPANVNYTQYEWYGQPPKAQGGIPTAYDPRYVTEPSLSDGMSEIVDRMGRSLIAPSVAATTTSGGIEGEYYEGTTEHRKIIIKELTGKSSESTVKEWIRSTVGRHAAEIEWMDVLAPTSRHRGHAFVYFHTEKAARRAAEKCHGRKFNTKAVSARVTIEGVASEGYAVAAPREATYYSTKVSMSSAEGIGETEYYHIEESEMDASTRASHRDRPPVIAYGSRQVSHYNTTASSGESPPSSAAGATTTSSSSTKKKPHSSSSSGGSTPTATASASQSSRKKTSSSSHDRDPDRPKKKSEPLVVNGSSSIMAAMFSSSSSSSARKDTKKSSKR